MTGARQKSCARGNNAGTQKGILPVRLLDFFPTTIDGRLARSGSLSRTGKVRAYISFPDACNGIFSGLAADAAGMAYAAVCRACELAQKGDPLYDCHPVLTVPHDSIVLEGAALTTLHHEARY